jgi:hypothetical protein
VTASELLAVLSQQDRDALVDALVQAIDSYGPDLPVAVEDGSPGKVRYPSATAMSFTVYVQR